MTRCDMVLEQKTTLRLSDLWNSVARCEDRSHLSALLDCDVFHCPRMLFLPHVFRVLQVSWLSIISCRRCLLFIYTVYIIHIYTLLSALASLFGPFCFLAFGPRNYLQISRNYLQSSRNYLQNTCNILKEYNMCNILRTMWWWVDKG